MSWPLAKLDNHVDILSGFAFKSENFNDRGEGLPLVRIRDVVPGVSDTYYSGEYSSDFLLSDGDLLIGMDGDFNRARWNGGQALLNQRVCKVTAKGESLDQRYLYHFLPKALDKIHAETPAVTVKHLSVKGIRAIEIPLPPLPEQKRIAAILDKADAIRRKRQQAIQLADDFLRAVFLDMFGDPVTNPKGWEVRRLEQLSTRITKGESPKWQGFEYGSEGVRFITSENVLWGSLDERIKFIPLEFHQKLKRSQVQENDLLINLVGASVGRACLAKLDGMPANINQAVSVTTLDSYRLLPEMALYQLLMPSMQRVLLGSAVDAARANISLADVRDLQMLTPPMDLQLAFLGALRKVQKYMEINSIFSNLKLFESLSQSAFSGQL
ncbi:restriction endonuclease subunit S [Stutzerimonas sp. KH-1]